MSFVYSQVRIKWSLCKLEPLIPPVCLLVLVLLFNFCATVWVSASGINTMLTRWGGGWTCCIPGSETTHWSMATFPYIIYPQKLETEGIGAALEAGSNIYDYSAACPSSGTLVITLPKSCQHSTPWMQSVFIWSSLQASDMFSIATQSGDTPSIGTPKFTHKLWWNTSALAFVVATFSMLKAMCFVYVDVVANML